MPTTRYREHDQVSHSYYTAQQYGLAQEWIRLNDDPAVSSVIRRWQRRQPLFQGIDRPACIVQLIDKGTHENRDRCLAGLIELFQSGQQLAGRIVLQAMLPKLSAYAFRSSVTSRLDDRREDRLQLVLCEFWDVLSAYPIERRRERVAANLALETLHRLTEAARTTEVPMEPDRINLLAHHGPVARDVEVSSDWNLDELLDWAVDRAVVSRADARLLADVYAVKPEARGSFRDVSEAYVSHAARSGVSQAALRQRTHRAKRRLTLAVRTTLAAGAPAPSPVHRPPSPEPAWKSRTRSTRPRGDARFSLDETARWAVST